MDARIKTAAAVAGIALGTAGVIAIGGGSKPSAPVSGCAYLVVDQGEFTATDEPRCNLIFASPGARVCELRPAMKDSIDYGWGFEVSRSGVVVRGLKRGARVTYECKEAPR